MPKRLCPFETMFSPQLKNHVSEKEVVFSEDGKSNMENIHAKTLQKLYLGAKSTSLTAPCTCGHAPSSSSSTNQSSDKLDHRYKQLRLDNQGQLIPSSTELQEGGKQETAETRRCSFCDIALPCQPCQRVCHRCQAVFCQQCCLNVFTDAEDTSLCLSCVR